LTGLLALLWSGRCLFMALELSLIKCWELPNRRPGWRSNLFAMVSALVLALLTLLLVIGGGLMTSLQVALGNTKLPSIGGWTLADATLWTAVHTWVVVPLATCAAFSFVYTSLPFGGVNWKQVLPGALFCAAGWRVTSWLYIRVIWEFGASNPLYGSLWSVVGLLIWLYLQACVFLLGAELIYVSGRLRLN
jgi:membrane protein